MLFDYPVHHKDFERARDNVLCEHCQEEVVDFTSDSSYCISCRKRHGALCGEDGCLADSAITTEDGLKCKRHAATYLETLVSNAYQLLEKLYDEHDKIADKVTKVRHNEEGKESSPAEYQQEKYMLERMEDNHQSRINRLGSIMAEISKIQEKLGAELVDASY